MDGGGGGDGDGAAQAEGAAAEEAEEGTGKLDKGARLARQRAEHKREREASSSSRRAAREQLLAWLRLFCAWEAPSRLHEPQRRYDD